MIYYVFVGICAASYLFFIGLFLGIGIIFGARASRKFLEKTT